jgi:serine/threonine protein phosphatase PrpC
MRIRPGIEIGSLTDVGCHRDSNEDYFSYWEPESEEEFAHKGRLAIVADGMGGYEGGQEASRLAVEVVVATYGNAADDPQAALLASLQAAHEQIRQYGETHPQLLGLGTTCTALALHDRRLYFAHVGDSRLYLVRGDTISRLTRDHSYVGRLIESGVISSREAETHPQRHILTAALGTGVPLEADFPEIPVPLENDDVLVLCTDGLWGQVDENELLQIVGANSAADACRELVAMAKYRGGPDNITVQILRLSLNGHRQRDPYKSIP